MFLEKGKFYETQEGKQLYIVDFVDVLEYKNCVMCQKGFNPEKVDRNKISPQELYEQYFPIENIDYSRLKEITKERFLLDNYTWSEEEMKVLKRKDILKNKINAK